MERTGVVTLKGNPVMLVGPELRVGDAAPSFELLDGAMRPVKSTDYKGKVLLISVVPSLDTPICELQTVRFNKEAAQLPDSVGVLTVSMDLPFAQTRFCTSLGIGKITVASDHRTGAFGEAYGVLMKEVRLLARSIFVVGKDGKIAYVQIVPEVSTHPDYDKALAAVRAALG